MSPLLLLARVLSALSLLALSLNTALAQTRSPASFSERQLPLLNPVVVSAARVEQPLADVIPSLTVISREEIERSGAPTLIDLIQGEAGVEIGRNGGPGTVSSIFLRGQNSVSAAVFIDGVRAQTDQIGTIKLIDIPLNMIDRIEILRGNVGALYGESAIGGVINIYTRAPGTGPGVQAALSAGSFNTYDLFARVNTSLAATRYQLSFQRFQSGGFSAMTHRQNSAVNPDRDQFHRESIFARVDHDLSPQVSVGLSANSIQSAVDYDSGFAVASDTHQLKTNSSDLTLYSRLRLLPDVLSNVSLTHSDLLYLDYKNASQLSEVNGGRIRGQQNSLRVDNTAALRNGAIIFGLESIASDTSSRGSRHERQQLGGYLGYSARAGRLDVQANTRVDEVSGMSSGSKATQSASTWLAGVGFAASDFVRLTASMSTAFRAPATGELYGWGGNPGLRPEEHSASELGISVTTSLGALRLVHFESNTHNAIVYANSTYINVGRVENRGLELNYGAQLGEFRVKLSAVSQDPRNAQTGARLARRAKEYGSLDLSSARGRYELGGRLIVSGDRMDGTVRLEPYSVLNLYVGLRLDPQWQIRVRLENALDRDYQLVYGYNTPPRGIFATLRYSPAN